MSNASSRRFRQRRIWTATSHRWIWVYLPGTTASLFPFSFSLSLSLSLSLASLFFLLHAPFFSETRTHAGADQVRISRPPVASRPPLSPSINASFTTQQIVLYRTRPLFISPINFDASQCVSAPRLARSYRTGLSPAAKLDLTGLLDGRVITCKSYTVIKRGIERRYTKRSGTANQDFK